MCDNSQRSHLRRKIMITTRTLAYLSLVSLLPFTSLVHAEMGPYVGIGAGVTQFNDDGFIGDITENSDWDDTGTAYRFLAGYKFSDNFSVEWTYQDYDYNEYGIESLSSVDLQAWHISGVVLLPIEDSPLGKMDVFGKLGFGESDFSFKGLVNFGNRDEDPEDETLNVSEEQSSESFILGAGAQFYVDEHFRIRTELDLTTFVLDAAFGTSATNYLTKDYLFTGLTASASLVYAF